MATTPYAFGVIPARGGSKGLPGKNLRKLGALSLIGHAVASAREAEWLTRFIVSTDSAEIAEDIETIRRDLKILVVHGEWNARVSVQAARRDVSVLRAGGLRVAFQSYPCAHRLTSPMLSDVDTWLINHCTAEL